MAPFVCVMADVVAKKYSILTWTPEIVDYVLKCGAELHSASKFRYDQVKFNLLSIFNFFHYNLYLRNVV